MESPPPERGPGSGAARLTDGQYHVLLVFRSALRRYLQWSSEEAASIGLTPQQHQLLLAVRGHPGRLPPSITELSRYLLIRHHSTVELANRCVRAGLITRDEDKDDQRVVRLRLTEAGLVAIERLSGRHLAELQRVSDRLGISEDLLEHLSAEFAQNLGAGVHAEPPEG